jgi:hypothetical protein
MKKGSLYCITLCALLFIGCKKNNGDGSATPPGPTKGQSIFFLKQDCNVGNVAVTVSGITKTIKSYSTYTPSCDTDSSYAIFALEPGDYSFSAIGGTTSGMTWSGSITITTGNCSSMQLTCDGTVSVIKGLPGTPRFNLSHSANVDFDLHLTTPDGSNISWASITGQGGRMDLTSGCLGDDDNPGFSGFTRTTENIWWLSGSAPHGTYQFHVQYSGYCGSSATAANFTLRVVDGLSIIKTYTGTLTASSPKSATYTFIY